MDTKTQLNVATKPMKLAQQLFSVVRHLYCVFVTGLQTRWTGCTIPTAKHENNQILLCLVYPSDQVPPIFY